VLGAYRRVAAEVILAAAGLQWERRSRHDVVAERQVTGMFFQYLVARKIADLEHKDFTPNERPAGDLYAHAPGRICQKCDRRILASQAARRRGESGWVHDVCPD